MPVTGNNTGLKEKILSIRVNADGLCFWIQEYVISEQTNTPVAVADMLKAYTSILFDPAVSLKNNMSDAVARVKKECSKNGKPDFDGIYVYPDTIKTILVPEEVYLPGTENSYVDLHNYSVEAEEQIDVSKPLCGTVAVMVSSEVTLRMLGESLGEFAVASLSQYNLLTAEATGGSSKYKERNKVVVYLSGSLMYISVFASEASGAGLIYNSIMPYAKSDDIIFNLDWVKGNVVVGEPVFYLEGSFTEEIAVPVRKQFKDVVCV